MVRPSLESLLAASSHMLKEVLDGPFVDPLKNLRLPRELNPNKKYSWMQKKDERVRWPGPGWRGGVGRGRGTPRAAVCVHISGRHHQLPAGPERVLSSSWA